MIEQNDEPIGSSEKLVIMLFKIMRIHHDNSGLTQPELADQQGMSVGGLNYCLKALIEKGCAKMVNF